MSKHDSSTDISERRDSRLNSFSPAYSEPSNDSQQRTQLSTQSWGIYDNVMEPFDNTSFVRHWLDRQELATELNNNGDAKIEKNLSLNASELEFLPDGNILDLDLVQSLCSDENAET